MIAPMAADLPTLRCSCVTFLAMTSFPDTAGDLPAMPNCPPIRNIFPKKDYKIIYNNRAESLEAKKFSHLETCA